jgi:4-hydroxybenzoate polyprenyltransferase
LKYLRLIRLPNLLMIALVQLLIRYGLFEPMQASLAFTSIDFVLFILATICIAAGGNIINDIYDVEIDLINKPQRLLVGVKISEKRATTLYFMSTVVGVAVGFYLSNRIGKPGFSALFIIIAALLYLYASYLKSIVLIGNILISILVAMSILIVGIFDLLPTITTYNQEIHSGIFIILLQYAAFAFVINFIREIVKDLEDINGDKNGGMNTLPIAIGRKRTITLVFGLLLVTIVLVVIYMYSYLYSYQVAVLYFLLVVLAPLFYALVKAWTAEKQKDYAQLSSLLKGVMFTGMCSFVLYKFVIV